MDFNYLSKMGADEVLTELADPANYRGYLQVMAHFSGYSWRNIFLIFKQCHNATKLVDYHAWKSQYRRNVVTGAKHIKIYVPDGQPHKNDFKPSSYIDISQTTGAPVPILAGDVTSGEAMRGGRSRTF